MTFPTPTTAEAIGELVGASSVVFINADKTMVGVPILDLDPATVYSVLAGEAGNAPDQNLALARWETGVEVVNPVGDLVTAGWPSDSSEFANRPAHTFSDMPIGAAEAATAAGKFGVSEIADAALLAASAGKSFRRRFQFRNTFSPVLTMTPDEVTAGLLPTRFGPWGGDLDIPFGQIGVIEAEVSPSSVLVTDAYVAENEGPGLISLVIERGGASPTTTTFQPWLRQTDPVVVFMHRQSGSAITVPTGKGYDQRTEGGLTSGALVAGSGGLRVAVSADHGAAGVFADIGNFTNATAGRSAALRGCTVQNLYAHQANSSSFTWEQLASLPEGARILGFTAVNLNAAPPRPAGVNITTYRTTQAGWTYELFLTDPLTAFEPAAVALGSAVQWISAIAVLVPTE